MTLKKYYNILPYLIIISAFGIYVGGGLRVEHIIIYPSILLFLINAVLTNKKLLKGYFGIFLLWFSVVILAFFVSLKNGGQVISVIADAEGFVQTMALMILFMFLSINVSITDVNKKLITASKIFITMLCFNSIFICYSMFFDVTEIGKYFWGGEYTVAHRAMSNGRYSGVFNQPMEAGVAYSIGLFAWLYLSDKKNIFKIRDVISLFLMIVGGLVTVSKVFLFGGLPLFFLGVLLNKNLWKMIFKLTFWSVGLGGIAYFLIFKTWKGLDYLLRFLNPTDGFLTLMTAGRFGEDSIQSNYFSNVWDESPFFGLGFGVTETYDSGYFQFFAISGTIGLLIYLLILLTLFYISIKFLQRNKIGSESKFFVLLTILIISSSFGAPTLTLNRVSTILWIFIGLLLQYLYFEGKQKEKIDISKVA